MTNQFWSQSLVDKIDLDLIRNIYTKDLKNLIGKSKKISDLEINHFFENYLWANFNYEDHHNNIYYLMSIILMINEKFRENIDVWEFFKNDKQKFSNFFTAICKTCLSNDISIIEKINILIFFIKIFGSLEIDLIRQELSKYISPSIWLNLSEKRRLKEIEKLPKLKKYFKQLDIKDSKLNSEELKNVQFERSFLVNYINNFLDFLNQIPSCDKEFKHQDKKFFLIYCERFIEFLIDLESVSPIRRFLNVVLDEKHVYVILRNSNLSQRQEGKLFNQMLDILQFYIRFELNKETNEELSVEEISIEHYKKIANLQKIIFKEFVKYKEFYLSTVSQIDNNEKLMEFFKSLPSDELKKLALILNFYDETTFDKYSRELVEKVLVFHFQTYVSQIEKINELSLYPTEDIIWDENIVPSQYYNSENCLAIPKLNLQFLTLQDYLSKNIHLFRLESTFEIRQDIEKAIFQMKPWINDRDEFIYGGISRMAMKIDSFSIVDIKAPKIGQKCPSKICAEVKILLNVKDQFKKEWESLRKHDVCFLITLKPKLKYKTKFNLKDFFLDQVELSYVRGCELEGMLDSQGKIVDENSNEKLEFNDNYRTYRVYLDPNQYYEDTKNQKEELYDSFNIIVRRKPKENNFKAVLETIKDLINTKFIVPDWLHDLLLGYGHPSSAHYSELLNNIETFNFNDTFIDLQHLKDSFPNSQISYENNDQNLLPPYVLKFEDSNKKVIHVSNPANENNFYFENKLKINKIRFTSTQIEAIYSGMQNGLTLIVGPPGTGKTDVAVQIISNIYQNFPNQRTLIVTHSNQALNQLFEKIMCLNIDEKHLLRLGHGEEELETEKDFSRYGRVNYVLGKRLLLLYEVGRLAKTLNVNLDAGCSCETAAYFYLYHVLSKYEEFVDLIYKSDKTNENFEQLFPFKKYFEQENQNIFTGTSFEQNINIANYYFRKLKKIFTEIEEFRAFEILRSNLERSNFLLIKEAKIIAMTCTHAALKRRQLVELGFQYDNILMEEAAQILEIETFIPLLLQNPEHGHNRLKRWIMIGDHNQLPPIIKNTAFQKYGNMEQSLFKRFIRLGVPAVHLNAQGRSRPSLCSLFKWRYENLNDLNHVKTEKVFLKANAGFVYEYQFINVDDFEGVGETEPSPYFYQNEAEAEYVILQFIYMRLIGYPAEKITILTTYNGQKQKIKEVFNDRLGTNEFFGQPSKITTVDKYQGMQNDYIILSLVRTKAVGHLRDIRRLVVAMSRARLGLYIYGKFNLFKNCLELQNVFDKLNQRPQQLHLFINEDYLADRNLNEYNNGTLKVISTLKEMTDFVLSFYPEKLEYWKKVNPDYVDKIINKDKKNEEEMEENMSDDEGVNDENNLENKNNIENNIENENNSDNESINKENDVNENNDSYNKENERSEINENLDHENIE